MAPNPDYRTNNCKVPSPTSGCHSLTASEVDLVTKYSPGFLSSWPIFLTPKFVFLPELQILLFSCILAFFNPVIARAPWTQFIWHQILHPLFSLHHQLYHTPLHISSSFPVLVDSSSSLLRFLHCARLHPLPFQSDLPWAGMIHLRWEPGCMFTT